MRTYIQINPADNVVVAVKDLQAGASLDINGKTIVVLQDIPAGHKVALQDFREGDPIIKYGAPIGHAREAIAAGSWVNEKNIKTNLEGLREYEFNPQPIPEQPSARSLSFKGYRRKNGEVGIRNEIWVIPTVGCVNGITHRLADKLQQETQGVGVDAIVAFPHNYGCSQLGDDHENTRKILRDMVLHPNAGAVLVVGLGCENNQVGAFREMLGDYDTERIRFMETQKVDDELETGMELLRELYAIASQDRRTEIPLSELRVGLKCGGSDGFSGISANPVIGEVSDRVVTLGGGSSLAEFPELCGVEANMISRCIRKEDKARFLELMRRYEAAANACGASISDNPSPGNIHDGLITDAIKSAGAAKKGGKAPISAVLDYAEPMPDSGLSLVCTPGNDVEAVTGLVAAGVNVVLFSTGLGTPTGNPIVPVIKVATNTAVAERLSDLIDFDCGPIIDGEPIAAAADRLLEKVLDTASGRYSTKADRLGQHDFLFWKREVSL